MTEYEKRAMLEAEDKYTFSQSPQLSEQTGLIGYLRADMDTDGNGFFSSWFDWKEELKTDEFKLELDEVINSLREEGDILYNRKALANYCYSTPQSRMQTEQEYYGVRVDTEKYAYLLRLNPNKGDYNIYCYCYVRALLDGHARNTFKTEAKKCMGSEKMTDNEKLKVAVMAPDGTQCSVKWICDDDLEIIRLVGGGYAEHYVKGSRICLLSVDNQELPVFLREVETENGTEKLYGPVMAVSYNEENEMTSLSDDQVRTVSGWYFGEEGFALASEK